MGTGVSGCGGGAGHDGAGAGAVGLGFSSRSTMRWLRDRTETSWPATDRAQRADRGLLLGDVRERVELVPAHRVLVGDLVDVVVGHAVLDDSRGSSSGACGHSESRVRVVALPADVVDADLVAQPRRRPGRR